MSADSDPSDDLPAPAAKSDSSLRAILERLRSISGNPVSRARKLVELQVAPSQRGPGWDRHWRELEAYLETPMAWQGLRSEPSDDLDDDG